MPVMLDITTVTWIFPVWYEAVNANATVGPTMIAPSRLLERRLMVGRMLCVHCDNIMDNITT